ncbi:MAG: DinB family protein [Fibrella sp.]|nr:DinB family protein [Armatimonadota bacterium]
MLPMPARAYLLAALDNTPATLFALLSHLPSDSPVWDTLPQPDRFSLREIVAHLADWEHVFRERFERTINEDRPVLPRPDLNERAEEKGYADADPQECLARFREVRPAMTNWLRSLPEDAWVRVAHLERIGDLSLEGLVILMAGHDSYHIKQVTEWLS